MRLDVALMRLLGLVGVLDDDVGVLDALRDVAVTEAGAFAVVLEGIVEPLAAEITREKLYLRLHQELPYASHVETEKWEEKKDGSVRIEQVIYVERDGQKKIVLGHKGETIRAIGEASRKELAEILEQKVHLFLFVKVRENWGDDPDRYKEMGLDFPEE